jgi:alcohol dehydrogenase (cytochrome c)
MDLKTNRLIWQQKWTELCYSGSVTTASGLIFVGRSDGRFLALDARTGSWLWEFQTGAGVNAPASVFEYQGRQYVTVLSAGNLFGRGPKGDSLWLFSLDGTLEPVDPPSAVPARR